VATGRGGIDPLSGKDSQNIINGFWRIWLRLGIPENLQVDNELSYHGSHRHPHGMGALIRLCLYLGIELWFIPMADPWRNGVIEKFNDHYEQKFLNKVTMTSFDELVAGSLAFENRHNTRYRYSKLGGKTPLMTLTNTKAKLSFPTEENPLLTPSQKGKLGATTWCASFAAISNSTYSERFFPSHPNSSTSTWWLLSMSKNRN
jgi:putative transposase